MRIRLKRATVLVLGLALLGAATHANDETEADAATGDRDDHYASEEGLRVPHLLGWGVRVGVAVGASVVGVPVGVEVGVSVVGVPVKLVGLGEGPDDLAPFEAEEFVDALLA